MIATSTLVLLREWEVKDSSTFLKFHSEYDKWKELNGPYFKEQTLEEIQNMFPRMADHLDGIPEALVIEERTTGEFIGLVNWYWISKETNWPAVGVVIYDEKKWKKGLGFQALGLWCDFLFSCATFARLDMRTWSGNHGIQHLAKKLGFTEEARFRKARIVKGEYYDALGFGILREEWEALYPSGFFREKPIFESPNTPSLPSTP